MTTALDRALGPRTQAEQARGDQVLNSAGGFVFEVDDWARLHRFLTIGTDGGTHYVNEREITREVTDLVFRLVATDGLRVVEAATKVSLEGRAARNDQAIFAIAAAVARGNAEVRRSALDAFPKVCRIGTHLFTFCRFYKAMGGGWGRSVKRAVGAWYDREDFDFQMVKYRQRGGWSHRDVLRMAHPTPTIRPEFATAVSPPFHQGDAFLWATHPDRHRVSRHTPEHLRGFLELQDAMGPNKSREASRAIGSKAEAEVVKLIEDRPFISHEMIDGELKTPKVWHALLRDGFMPLGALIRNLPTLTRHGLLDELGKIKTVGMEEWQGRPTEVQEPNNTRYVVKRLSGMYAAEELGKARIHPMNLLVASMTYEAGRSVRGSSTWTPNPEIVHALGEAFHLSFKTAPPIEASLYIGVDVSASMGWGHNVMGIPGFTAAHAAAGMAVTLKRKAARSTVWGFGHKDPTGRTGWTRGNTAMRDLRIHGQTPITRAMKRAEAMTFGLRPADDPRKGSRMGRGLLRRHHRQRDLVRECPPLRGPEGLPQGDRHTGAPGGPGHDPHEVLHRRSVRSGDAGHIRVRFGGA